MARRETEPDRGETRELILRTSRELFMELGYRTVSTRQIAQACGLTQPAIYHHFATKQDLYVEMLKEELAGTRAALERSAKRGEDPEERLQHVARYLLAQVGPSMSQMLHDIAHELDATARLSLNALFFQDLVAPIAAIIADGQHQGTLRLPGSGGLAPPAAALLLLAMLQRPGAHAAATGFSTSFPAENDTARADLVVHILLHGLATIPVHIPSPADHYRGSAPAQRS